MKTANCKDKTASVSKSLKSRLQTGGSIVMLIVVVVILILMVVNIIQGMFEIINTSNQHAKDITEIRRDGKRSPTHQFVADKFLACESRGFISPGKDACVAQVIQLSKLNGPEFEKNVLLAIKDMGLN